MGTETDLEAFLVDFGGARPVDAATAGTDLLYGLSLRTAAARAASFVDWRNAAGETLVLACGFARAREMNAVAGREGATHCLAVFEPLIGAFFDFFSCTLSIPTFLPTLGDPARERLERLDERHATLGFGYLAAARDGGEEALSAMTLPQCPFRAHVALHMAHVAYDFIWSHELWHAAQGHVGYAATLNVAAMNELPNDRSDGRLLPLETEADRLATFWIADQAFQASTPYLAVPIKLDAAERLHVIRLTLVLTAYFWAHLQRIEIALGESDPYAMDSHPAPLLRLHFTLEDANTLARGRRGLSPREIRALDERLATELDRLAEATEWFTILRRDVVFSADTVEAVRVASASIKARREAIEPALATHRFTAETTATRPRG